MAYSISNIPQLEKSLAEMKEALSNVRYTVKEQFWIAFNYYSEKHSQVLSFFKLKQVSDGGHPDIIFERLIEFGKSIHSAAIDYTIGALPGTDLPYSFESDNEEWINVELRKIEALITAYKS